MEIVSHTMTVLEDLCCLKVGEDETYLFFFEVAEKKRGSLICSLLHRGQRLGA